MLLVPKHVAANMEREKWVFDQEAHARDFNKLLKEIDANLSLAYVGEGAPPLPGMQAGRWHVKRKNPGTVDSYMPITGPKGEYREPDSGVLFELQEHDLWNPRVAKRVREAPERERKRLERDRQNQHKARSEEIALNIKAIESPGVLITKKV